MYPIVIATVLLTVLGILGAVLLVAASKFLAVSEDEKVEQLQAVLPGANCGGCGYAGCSAYAKAIAEGAPVNQCTVGGQAVAEKLAAIMGVEAGATTSYKAIVACKGTGGQTRFDYQGIPSCRACNTLFHGQMACPYGCLGFGDCAAVCPTGAISVVDGTAHVDTDKCVGCGMCKQACPKKSSSSTLRPTRTRWSCAPATRPAWTPARSASPAVSAAASASAPARSRPSPCATSWPASTTTSASAVRSAWTSARSM